MPDCPTCHKPGRAVSSKAVSRHAPPGSVEGSEGWQLCLSGADCRVVYFRGTEVVSIAETAAAPFHKGTEPERLVCFCFGHTERDITEDLGRHGVSTLRDAIAEACRGGRSDCEALNPEGRCCLGNVAKVIKGAASPPDTGAGQDCCSAEAASTAGAAAPPKATERTTLHTLRDWVRAGVRISMFTCYDATTARWLCRGGARVLLVGDSAAQLVLGLAPEARASLSYMAAIGAAVKRGAPEAFVVVDYPDELVGAASDHIARLRELAEETGADAIKVESDAASLVEMLGSPLLGSVPLVAHLAPRLQVCKCCSVQEVPDVASAAAEDTLIADAVAVATAGASAVLLSAAAPRAAAQVVAALRQNFPSVPIFGCYCGDGCPGQVEMLHEVLGLRGDDSPDGVGHVIAEAVRRRLRVRSSDA